MSWECNFCHETKRSSYTRVRAHLLKLSGCGIAACKKVTNQNIIKMQRLEEEVNERVRRNAPKKVPLPPSSVASGGLNSVVQGSYDLKRRKTSESGSNTAIGKAFNMKIRDHGSRSRYRSRYRSQLC